MTTEGLKVFLDKVSAETQGTPWRMFTFSEIPPEVQCLAWHRRPWDINEVTDALDIAATLLSDCRLEWLREEELAKWFPHLILDFQGDALWAEYFRRKKEDRARMEGVINERHRELLRIAAEILPSRRFELAGGTALAAGYLGHRQSEDLDFFTTLGFRVEETASDFMEACIGRGIPVEEDKMDWDLTFRRFYAFEGSERIKVELMERKTGRLGDGDRQIEGMPVASIRDLAGDKAIALASRGNAVRDFIDVYMISQRVFDLSVCVDYAQRKFPDFNTTWFAKALQGVDRLDPSKVKMLVSLRWEEVKRWAVDSGQRLLRWQEAEGRIFKSPTPERDDDLPER